MLALTTALACDQENDPIGVWVRTTVQLQSELDRKRLADGRLGTSVSLGPASATNVLSACCRTCGVCVAALVSDRRACWDSLLGYVTDL